MKTPTKPDLDWTAPATDLHDLLVEHWFEANEGADYEANIDAANEWASDMIAEHAEERVDYPDPSGPYRDLQAAVKAADQTEWADKLSARLCSGTTSGRGDYQTIFVGKHIALVKWKGGTSGSGMSRYHVSGDVRVFSLTEKESWGSKPLALGWDGRPGRRVWDLDTRSGEPDSGRLQGQALRDLIEKAIDLDKHYDERRAAHKAEIKAEQDAKNREDAERQARHRADVDEARDLCERVRYALSETGQFTEQEVRRVVVMRQAGGFYGC